MEPSDIIGTLNFIPEPYRSWLIVLALMVLTLSCGLATLKKVPGFRVPDPSSGPLQLVAFWLLHLADFGAGNSTTFKTLAAELHRSRGTK